MRRGFYHFVTTGKKNKRDILTFHHFCIKILEPLEKRNNTKWLQSRGEYKQHTILPLCQNNATDLLQFPDFFILLGEVDLLVGDDDRLLVRQLLRHLELLMGPATISDSFYLPLMTQLILLQPVSSSAIFHLSA